MTTGRDRTVLVVDDDLDIRESLTDVLTDEGYRVQVVGDGLQALQYLRQHPLPCLILLDWMMPRCDGPQFRQQQKADPAFAEVPVVLLTADVRLEEKAAEIDARAHLRKPVQLERLLEVVARFCTC